MSALDNLDKFCAPVSQFWVSRVEIKICVQKWVTLYAFTTFNTMYVCVYTFIINFIEFCYVYCAVPCTCTMSCLLNGGFVNYYVYQLILHACFMMILILNSAVVDSL